MIRTALPFLPALLFAAPGALSAAEEHVISYENGTCVTVTTGDGYTDERTVPCDEAGDQRPCRHHRRHHHEDDEVQYSWDGTPYDDGCGGPAVRVAVIGPCLPPPRIILPPPRVLAPAVAVAAHAGFAHGLAVVGATALRIAAIPLVLPFALHR